MTNIYIHAIAFIHQKLDELNNWLLSKVTDFMNWLTEWLLSKETDCTNWLDDL